MARQPAHQTKPNPEKNPRRDPTAAGQRDAAVNRIASHNYFLLEKFEAGVALTGTEVKSVRAGRANLKASYGLIKNGRVKVELALAKGKQLWDKRETERRRTADREAREAVARGRRR